ncbi:MAG: hypothetical protein OXM02_14615 [Bacteroidota bacterium]|nr:hypothetical protein [Bacteroidota bacterium]
MSLLTLYGLIDYSAWSFIGVGSHSPTLAVRRTEVSGRILYRRVR